MAKEFIIILLLSISFAVSAALIKHRPDIKEAKRKQGRDYAFVDLEIGCECGQRIRMEFSTDTKDLWPIWFNCTKCDTKYVLTKTRQVHDG